MTTHGDNASGLELFGQDEGEVRATVSDNEVLAENTNAIAVLLSAEDSSLVCADLSGNTSISSGMTFDLGVFQEDDGIIEIVGFSDFPALSVNNNNSFDSVTAPDGLPDSTGSCSVR